MCLTLLNPSEPCCSDADRRCTACEEIDWKNYTWLWEQPQAVAMRSFTGIFPIIGNPSDTVTYDTRYAALRQKMTKGLNCNWSTTPSREFYLTSQSGNQVPHALGEWILLPGFYVWSATNMIDLNFPDEPDAGHFFLDGWHSAGCTLRRVLIDNRWEWRAGWPGAVEYVLRGESFDCEGVNEFFREDSIAAEDLPVWLTLDHFPEWIRVSRVTT